MENIAACIINFARPWNIPIICRSLMDFGFQEILVWDQGYDKRVNVAELLPGSVRIISSDHNVFTLGRHLLTDKTDSDYIITLDDDYVVTDDGWTRLLDNFDGEQICCQLPSQHGKFSNAYTIPWTNLGWGSIYPRSLVVDFMTKWLDNYGFDRVLSMKADRAFTSYVGTWHALKADISIHYYPLANPTGNLSETDQSSIHLRDDHWELTKEANSMAIALRSMGTSHRDLETYLTPSTN